MNSEADTQAHIQSTIDANPVVLYMKGTPSFPQCGFSQVVAKILSQYSIELVTVNVLEDDAIREGIKVFSQWPTIPQLYVKGEFIGGCDIVQEMQASGELAELLKTVETV